MKNKAYNFIFKTGDAELRAIEKINTSKKNIFPIIELTRGRKSKNDEIGHIKKRLDKVATCFSGCTIGLDITTSASLSNSEIDELYSSENGYQNWVDFLTELNDQQIYKKIVPTILVNTEGEDFEANLLSQVEKITQVFPAIIYRNSLADDGCYDDIALIKDVILQRGVTLVFVVDCEYVAPGAWRSFASKSVIRINKIFEQIPNTVFFVASTSFPNNISEIGKEDEDTFKLCEIDLYEEIKNNVNRSAGVFYCDYGSINPIRNDGVVMSRGWVPRIDVCLENEIYYKREKRGGDEYSVTYNRVAQRVVRDFRFPRNLSSNWGITQIYNCSQGDSPGANPSFWISVRMSIHIEQQMRRLGLI